MLKKTKIIQNVSQSSLILGKLGVLRSMVVKEISSDDAGDMNVLRHIKNGDIIVLKSLKDAATVVKENLSPVDDAMKPVVIKKPKGRDNNKNEKTIKKVSSGDLIIENGVEPGLDEDGINFVDIEQSEQRIAQHPKLGRLKKGK